MQQQLLAGVEVFGKWFVQGASNHPIKRPFHGGGSRRICCGTIYSQLVSSLCCCWRNAMPTVAITVKLITSGVCMDAAVQQDALVLEQTLA